jgi:hypothetical protein
MRGSKQMLKTTTKIYILFLIVILSTLLIGCDPYSADFKQYKKNKLTEVQAYADAIKKQYNYTPEGIQELALSVQSGIADINEARYYNEVDKFVADTKNAIDCVEVKLDYNAEKLIFALNSANRIEVPGLQNSFLAQNIFVGRNINTPKYKIHVIMNQAQLDSVFVESPQINFDNEMVLVVIYKSWVSSKWHLIRKIELDESVLKIYTRDNTVPYREDTPSCQVIYVFKMDKLDVFETELIFMGKEIINRNQA